MIPLLLAWEDPLEKEMAETHTLQCSCLGNPMDRGVCWVIAHGVRKELDLT